MRIIRAEAPAMKEKWRKLKYVSPSWLNSFVYCPYQIYLERVKGIKVAETQSMREGTKAHHSLEVAHKEMVEEIITVEYAMEESRKRRVGYLFREIPIRAYFDDYQIGGRIDELLVLPYRIEIIDDKPGHRAYDGGIIQVYAYAHAFVRRYSPQVPVHAVIRSRDSGEVIYRGEFGARERERVEERIKELLDVIYSRREPTVRINERKCASCRFRDVCPVRGAQG